MLTLALKINQSLNISPPNYFFPLSAGHLYPTQKQDISGQCHLTTGSLLAEGWTQVLFQL